MIGRALRAFGAFWVDFLIGDTPEFFVGTLVVIGVALALRHERAVALTLVPVLTIALLGFGTYRSRTRN
jgi:hypothetical protein